MGVTLAKIESSSKRGTYHTITQGKDGVIYCDCWAWKKNKHCQHLDMYHYKAMEENVKRAVRGPEPIGDIIDRVVNDLRRR